MTRPASSTSWLFYPQAALLIISIRAGLSLLPFPRLLRALARLHGNATLRPESVAADQRHICRTVERVGRLVPGASCLTRALAAQVLLAREGIATELRIGVQMHGEASLRAHAWLERDGVVVLGGSEHLERFVPLPPLRSGRG